MINVSVHLAGTTPLLLNNSRSANQLNPDVRDRAAIMQKRNKTWNDHVKIAAMSARLACYETDGGVLALPTANTWRALWDAAKKSRKGEVVKEALLFDPQENAEILIGGKPQEVAAFLEAGNVLTLIAKRDGNKRVSITRPIIPSGWETTHHFILDEKFMDADVLAGIAYRAQTLGIGDWRPRYGRFTAEVKLS